MALTAAAATATRVEVVAEAVREYRFRFNSETQLRSHFERSHGLILLGGAVGSGKTILHAHDLRVRAQHETDQLGAILTNTLATLEKGVFVEISKLFRALGMEAPVYGRRPSRKWFQRWARANIEIPPLATYRNVLTTPEGVHVVCGTLHHQSFHQYETMQFGWIRLEEAINNTLEALNTMLERVRCLTGGASNPDCARYHKHTRHLIFNPPRGAHPYLISYLDGLEEAAKAYYHALAEDETCDGCFLEIDDGPVAGVDLRRVPRVHGRELKHDQWPLLQQGVGEAILIRSKTSDNAANLDRGYRARLAMNMTKDTARRRLDGEIVRETAGRAYIEWSSANMHSVKYDPDRDIYLGLDFNLEPRAAVLAHPLKPGEYDSLHERPGVRHLGVFGEFFYAAEMDDRRFAQELVKGGRGYGGENQPKYRSEDWRGLPPPCNEECEQPCREGHWNGLKAHRGMIIAFGDQRGTYRSAQSGEASWDIVEKVFFKLGNYGRNVPDEQPAPRSRVDSVNAKLCNEGDIRSLWIDPRCEELIRDFEQVMWDETGQALREWRRGGTGTEMHRTHLTDGLGYMVHRLFPGGDDEGGGVEAIVEQSTDVTTRRSRRFRYPLHRR